MIGQAHRSTTCDSNQEVEGLFNLIIEYGFKKITGKNGALVLNTSFSVFLISILGIHS